MTAFEEFGVLPEIGRAVDEMEWTLPTDVQAEAIPLILGGGDVLMAAETGSGKTGAFCLPILQIVWETLKDIEEGKGKKGGGATVAVKPWTMSFFDRGGALAVSPEGLKCQAREFKEWHGCRATTGVQGSGKYYYEATVTDEGLCRVGWSTHTANLDLGTCKSGFGFGGTGKKSNNRQFDDYGEAFGINDVIGCLLDLQGWEVKFTKNGVDLGVAFKIPEFLRREALYPAVVLKNAEMLFNFGEGDFKHPPPEGYVALGKADTRNVRKNPLAVPSAAAVEDGKPKPNAPQAIIIEPSRELAEQTLSQITKFKKYLKDPLVSELLLIGGVNVRDQMAVLERGVDIIVATPGRLEDLIGGGYLLLSHCRFFVLDEADGLLQQGYGDMIDRLHKQIPKITSDGRRLQMIVCSATLHSFDVKKMAERLMHFPTWVDLKGEDAVPETVHHVVVRVDPQKDTQWHNMRQRIQTDGVHGQDNVRPGNTTAETLSEAVKILKGDYCLKAIEEHNMDRAIIFCRTKLDCDNLEKYFKHAGGQKYSCVCLHGDRKPQERKANLEAFKEKRVKFLICTDVAARGIDVSRAERMGLAISLVASVPEKVWYHGEWCKSRGRNCWNTNLTDQKGCCIWYNEMNYLAEIEDHLNITIPQVDKDMKVPVNDFDGKVVYGEKVLNTGSGYKDHVAQLVPVVQQLADLESRAQLLFLKHLPVR
ncbi:ATP-dependent RNA helicase Ddx1 [Sergentomyia squamirostris]